MLREFFLGFIKIHVLHHASRGKICGVEIMRELKRHGYDISPGTLYPALHALEREGYLKSSSAVENGKIRKYYVATKKGASALEKSREKIRELVEEVMSD